MLVHVAEDGRSYDLPCASETAVDTVLASLHALTGILPENQLLICGDVRLEAGRPLGFYQLPSPDDSSSSSGRPPSSSSPAHDHHERRHLFLFNRSRLLPRSSPPSVEPAPEVAVPPVSTELVASSHPFDKSSNPLLRTLPSYERQFRTDLLQVLFCNCLQWGGGSSPIRSLAVFHVLSRAQEVMAQAFLHTSQQRFDICLRLVQEQHTQAQALRTACANMDVTGQHIMRSFDDFERSYTHQRERHADLLGRFQEDLQLLSSCPLPAGLVTATDKRCLLDFVKLPRLRQAFDECQVAHSQMESRVAELQGQFEEIKGGLRAMLRGPSMKVIRVEGGGASGNTVGEVGDGTGVIDVEQFLRLLDHRMQEGHRSIEEEETGVAILSEDFATVKRLLHDCLTTLSPSASPLPSPSSSPSSSHLGRRSASQHVQQQQQQQQQQSLQPLDAVAALDPMCTLHTNQLLPRVSACDQQLAALLAAVHSAKVQMTSAVHGHLQLVARLQTRVRDVRNQLHAFREAMAHQEAAFVEVAAARGLRRTYAACLAEVVRRHAFRLAYTSRAQELAEALGKMREEEVERRGEFARQQMLLHSQFGSSAAIPADLLSAMGLNELPSPCDVSIQSFDANLIQVSAADLPGAVQQVRERGGAGGKDQEHRGNQDGDCIPSMEAILAHYLSSGGLGGRAGEEESGSGAGDPMQRLSLENTRLRAELAVARATEGSGRGGGQHESGMEQWVEALARKEAELRQLASLAEERQRLIGVYESRMQEMETALTEQQAKLSAAAASARQAAPPPPPESSGQPWQGLSAGQPAAVGLPGGKSFFSVTEGDDEHAAGEAGVAQQQVGGGVDRSRVFGLSSEDLDKEESGQSTPELVGAEAGGEAGAVSCGSGSVVMGTGEREADGVCSELAGDLGRMQASPGLQQPGSATSGSMSAMCEMGDSVPHLDSASAGADCQAQMPAGSASCQCQSGTGDEEGTSALNVPGDKGMSGVSGVPPVAAGSKLPGAMETGGQAFEGGQASQGEVEALRGAVAKLEAEVRQKEGLIEELQGQLGEAQLLLQHKDTVLAECQLNCAHVENKLHEAREEARTNRCAAERKAAEYAALRSAAVHTRSLLERLARCLMDPPAGPGAAAAHGRGRTHASEPPPAKDILLALRAFANSLTSQSSSAGRSQEGESEEWVRGAVRVIVDAAMQLVDRAGTHEKLADELNSRLKQTAEALVEVCDKHESTKAALRERISLGKLQVQDLAVFFRNSLGHYQALTAPSPDAVPHFLSKRALALLGGGEEHGSAGQSPASQDVALRESCGPQFVVGRIVHIERGVVNSGAPPESGQSVCTYGLRPGSAYAAVSIALVAEGAKGV